MVWLPPSVPCPLEEALDEVDVLQILSGDHLAPLLFFPVAPGVHPFSVAHLPAPLYQRGLPVGRRLLRRRPARAAKPYVEGLPPLDPLSL